MPVSDALQVARASSPSNVVIVDCIEIRHESFPGPVRLTNQKTDFMATLEATAPDGAGTQVTFKASYFDLTLPREGGQGVQSLSLTVGNVDKEATKLLELAAANPTPIQVIYRHYLSHDSSAPAVDPPSRLTIQNATVDPFLVHGQASTVDWINKKIHKKTYDLTEFPGLRTA